MFRSLLRNTRKTWDFHTKKLMFIFNCMKTAAMKKLNFLSPQHFYHPNSLKNNIPYGQALRLKKICTNEADYHKSLTDLEQAFLKRGYQKNHLANQFQKASSKERSDLLSYKDKPEQERNLLFITTYNKSLPRIRYALNKH